RLRRGTAARASSEAVVLWEVWARQHRVRRIGAADPTLVDHACMDVAEVVALLVPPQMGVEVDGIDAVEVVVALDEETLQIRRSRRVVMKGSLRLDAYGVRQTARDVVGEKATVGRPRAVERSRHLGPPRLDELRAGSGHQQRVRR